MLTPSGRRHKTPCTDVRGLQHLLTILRGKVSEDHHTLLNETFLRYMAGDRSMVTKIENNAASNAPIDDQRCLSF